jgi:hypothetical protein
MKLRTPLSILFLGALLLASPLAATELTVPSVLRSSCGPQIDLETLLADPLSTLTTGEETQPLFLSCSGDNCDCFAVPCTAQCTTGDLACFQECRRQQLACAICCCAPPENWPPWVNQYC